MFAGGLPGTQCGFVLLLLLLLLMVLQPPPLGSGQPLHHPWAGVEPAAEAVFTVVFSGHGGRSEVLQRAPTNNNHNFQRKNKDKNKAPFVPALLDVRAGSPPHHAEVGAHSEGTGIQLEDLFVAPEPNNIGGRDGEME